jgi:chemotaxis protein methyltransferase CheR
MKSLEARHSRRLRIWSAGCSTGQEPYSIAMTLLGQAAGIQSWDARILATDVDSNVIDHATAGRYAADQADGVPETYRKRFTRRQRDGALEMTDDLRRCITFKQLNLMEPWPISGPFEIIFCRNVVIYFDKPTQATLFDRFASLMPVGGWLYIGHSESLFKVTERFRLIGGTIYQKVA